MINNQPTGRFLLKLAPSLLYVALMMMSGCAPRTRNVLFNTPKEYQKQGLAVVHINPDTTQAAWEYEHRLNVDDRIGVRFLNNFDIAEGVTITDGNQTTGVSFLVDKQGYVDLPMIDTVFVLGKTKQVVQSMLEQRYARHFKDPNIEVNVLNLAVTVQGEVQSPGSYPLAREKTTLLEVLASAGGLTQYAKPRVVKVIRGAVEGKEPEIFIFDLRQLETIETYEMILRDRDIIYVEPRDIRVVANALLPYSSFLSILSTVTTISVVAVTIFSR